MLLENLQCPACGVMNTVDIDNRSFTCLGCGKEAITEAAAAFTSAQEESIRNAPMARTVTSDDEESRMLRRAAMFLEDEDWPRAWSYYESVLDYNTENAQAYVGELLVKLRLKSAEMLSHSLADFSELGEFKRAVRYAEEPLRTELQGFSSECKKKAFQSSRKLTEDRNAQRERNEAVYKRANRMRLGVEPGGSLLEAVELFESLGDWGDSRAMAAECRKKTASSAREAYVTKAEVAACDPRKEKYKLANRMRSGVVPGAGLEEAAELFESLGDWGDSRAMAAECRKKILGKFDTRAEKYDRAVRLMQTAMSSEEFLEVAKLFDSLGGWKDSSARATECRKKALGFSYKNNQK